MPMMNGCSATPAIVIVRIDPVEAVFARKAEIVASGTASRKSRITPPRTIDHVTGSACFRNVVTAAVVVAPEAAVADDPPDEFPVLDDHGPVDAELVVRLGDLRLGRVRVEHERAPRLRRQEPEERERDPGQREEMTSPERTRRTM